MVVDTINGTKTYSSQQSKTLILNHTEWIRIQASACLLTILSGASSIPTYASSKLSTDNPNVWFELGYAIASKRDVVLVCSNERKAHFPFDVQHRNIIRYSTESSSDFETARLKITERLKAVLIKRKNLGQLGSVTSISRVEGLEQYEIAGLVAVAEEVNDPEDGISAWMFNQNMKQAGFSNLAGTLALKSLLDREMLERFEDANYDGETWTAFRITPKGMKWLLANNASLNLQIAAKEPQGVGVTEDDIPF